MWSPVPIMSELCSTACVLTRCLTSCVCLAKWIFTYLMSALSGLTGSSRAGAHKKQKHPLVHLTFLCATLHLALWRRASRVDGGQFSERGWGRVVVVGDLGGWGWAEEDEGRRIQQPTPGLWSMKGARQKNSSCSALGQDPPDCSFS